MPQVIEEPGDDDIERLARQLHVAETLIHELTGSDLSESADDLRLLQAVIDAGAVRTDQTYELQCLGVVLGRLLVLAIPGLDWAMVEDEYGRDAALRFEETPILLFPLTMISKRVENGQDVDVRALFDGVSEHVSRLRVELGSQGKPN
jgi:hypothetical protein